MPFIKNYLLILGILFGNLLFGQNYQAMNGSPYAGSLAPSFNPASVVHVPFAWDITPFSAQVKQSTNAFIIKNRSYLSSTGDTELVPSTGVKNRFVFATQDIRLLNTRISLNSKAAIAFGATIRNYMHATSSRSNWQDSVHTLGGYMEVNLDHLPLTGQFTGNAWAELYATYGQTILDDGLKILNAGITLKINRGLAGGYGKANDLRYIPAFSGVTPHYTLTGGIMQYGYSSNFDNIDSNTSSAANARVFLDKTYSSLGADLGLEYIIRSNDEDEEEGGYAYTTKIGLTVMDIGNNKFVHGSRSRWVSAGKPGISDTLIENKFLTVTNFDQFNDSLATIAGSITGVNGKFYIYRPTRIVLNADQHIRKNIYVNAELTLPLLPLIAKNSLLSRDVNLLTITPRWELRSLGAYLPIQFNTRNQLWIGGAVRAGPVLLGTHNLAALFSKNKVQTGGVYVAFTIRPGWDRDLQGDGPNQQLTGKQKRRLDCPKF